MSMPRFLPRRLSFLKICDILVAYLNAGAEKDYIGIGDVVSKSTVELHNISRNNNFLKSWGFIEESEKEAGKYRLTKEAAEFAFAYRIDSGGNHTREILRDLLSKDEMITKYVERAKKEKLDMNTMLVDLSRIVGDLRADKVGLNAFLNMLTFAFQIEGLYGAVKPSEPPKRPRLFKQVRGVPRRTFDTSLPMPMFHANLSITLSVSPEISPEKLKEYVKAILEAYDEYKKEGE